MGGREVPTKRKPGEVGSRRGGLVRAKRKRKKKKEKEKRKRKKKEII